MAPPYIFLTAEVAATSKGSLLKAALDGNLGRLKGIIKKLGMRPAAAVSVIIDGFGALHCTAAHGHLEVCKYLIEELGGDPNMASGVENFKGVTPFMFTARTDDVYLVKYFLDHGGDPMKVDAFGRSVLHYAAREGSCKVTQFLLSEGVPVDIDCGKGTPLFQAASNGRDKILLDHNADPNVIVSNVGNPLMCAFLYRYMKCMKLLIKAGADVNGKAPFVSPLLFATGQGGYTDYIPLLLKAGADPNVPDDLGWLPIVRAAFRECREEIEMLLPLTSPIPDVLNWSVDGVISYAKLVATMPVAKEPYDKRMARFKSIADCEFRQKKYAKAAKDYSLLIQCNPDATLYSNRSLCKLKMGDGRGALSDAKQCRAMRPDWAKGCYRQGAAYMLLKEYKQACVSFLDAEKLDPGNDEIKKELGKAMELMKLSPGQ